MRGSNNKSVPANKAAVSITSTLYDRRALDCTEDKPLVNSLNHLTFLASSSLKVREALSHDGGLERLVDILYECRNPKSEKERCIFSWKWVLAFQCLVLVGTRGTEQIRKRVVEAGIIPIIATILDNYLISKKSSCATHFGMSSTANSSRASLSGDNNSVSMDHAIPINTSDIVRTQEITTTINDIQSTEQQQRNVEGHFREEQEVQVQVQSRDGIQDSVVVDDDGTMMTEQIDEVFRDVRRLVAEVDQTILEAQSEIRLTEDDDVKKSKNITPKQQESIDLNEEYTKILKSLTFLRFLDRLNTSPNLSTINHELLTEYNELTRSILFTNMLANNQEISNILRESLSFTDLPCFKKSGEKLDQSIPRDFDNGILIPKEDDVIWSLQLLAFVSKYTTLRYELSDTYIVNGLSLRNNSIPPPLETDNELNDNGDLYGDDDDVAYMDGSLEDIHDFIISDEETTTSDRLPFNNSNNMDSIRESINKLNTNNSTSGSRHNYKRQKFPQGNKKKSDDSTYSYLLDNYHELLNEENRINKAMKLEKFALDISRFSHREHNELRLKNNRIYNSKRESYSKKWNYDNWDDFEMGPLSILFPQSQNIDPIIKSIKRLNIFPLVEKFTVKHMNSKDVMYWAGLIVRNSNRKDETKGGRRQCAYFGCGRWEDEPRQFAKCRRCKRAKYCSKECQSKAWTYHKYWCNAVSNSAVSVGSG
ncbi:hypothetical protein CANARDRAFT_183526, partial [[Candida] arabinofermentans NRRL YB-2248]